MTTPAMTTLKPLPCPFCGSIPEGPVRSGVMFRFLCPAFYHDAYFFVNNEATAIAAWNRRSPEVEGVLKQAAEALRHYAEKMVVPHGDIARAALARIEGVK